MDSILNDVCVLVTAAFVLTLVPGFRRPERSFLSRLDQGTALLVFLVLGLVEEATVSHAGSLNERIVAVCAAGLVAGPWAGLTVSVFVTWLAVGYHGLPLGSIAPAMLCGGLIGGLASPQEPKTGATAADRILPDSRSILAADRPYFPFYYSVALGALHH
jgi:LytS/YehU family sensor histidine kinase